MIALPSSRLLHSAFAAAALLLTTGTSHAWLYDVVNLGAAQSTSAHNWAVFTYGSNTSDIDTVAGGTMISGDMGLAGIGKLNISGSTISDDLITNNYYNYPQGSAVSNNQVKVTGGSTIGNKQNYSSSNDTLLFTATNDAKNASAAASNQMATAGSPTAYTGNAGTDTLSLTAQNGKYVLSLSTFILKNETLVLHGGPSDYFIFNIAGTFSLNNSTISLDGVNPLNVLYNYTGNGTLTLTNNTTINGIVLASSNTSALTMSGGTVNGQIIANKVTISGGTLNTVVSP